MNDSVKAPLPFLGKNVVLTGKLSALTREQAADAVTALGGKVCKSVNSVTNLLVVGSENSGKATVKLIKAEKLGVERWDESKFLETLKAAGYESGLQGDPAIGGAV